MIGFLSVFPTIAIYLLVLVVAGSAAISYGQENNQGNQKTLDENRGSVLENDEPEDESQNFLDNKVGRDAYNLGVAKAQEANLSEAKAAFLKARDTAGLDSLLRYQSAYNLGFILANQGTEIERSDEELMELLQESASWFNDAVRLEPEGLEDARFNLEMVTRQIQLLADKLTNQRDLLPRLNKIIEDERVLRDEIRDLVSLLNSTGNGANLPNSHASYRHAAVTQRSLMAEVSSIESLVQAEIQNINAIPEKERKSEDKTKLIQMENLDYFLDLARQRNERIKV